ncbi:IS66 family transposase [Paenibacillus oralis]|uniref:IS66 family transposase n=1 Tax=Paenibacillus oralis TaxID=2490856 RepID=UPI0026B99515
MLAAVVNGSELHANVTAPMPAPVVSGSLVSPSMMTYVISQKYLDSLPLYRHASGHQAVRQTLANWMIAGAERWRTG